MLVFGATGSAGGSVMRACVAASAVREVRVIARRAPAFAHGKLRTYLHADFLDYAAVAEAFDGIDACLFCLGVSATQVSGEDEYRRITRDFAVAAARMLRERSPGAAFHYVSGKSTQAASRMMWSRVKAEAEQALMDEVAALCWRPGFIDGAPSAAQPAVYRAMRPVLRLLRVFPGLYVTGDDIGRAMLQLTVEGARSRIVENREIRDIARRAAPELRG